MHARLSLLQLLTTFASLAMALPSSDVISDNQVAAAGAFFNPAQGGGSMLANGELHIFFAPTIHSLIAYVCSQERSWRAIERKPRVSELQLRRVYISSSSLQVIISGLSSPQVLSKDGIINYARAIGL
jgi:hypothetical protein